MDWKSLSETLSATLKRDIHIETAHPLAGGDIHQAFQLHTTSGNYFLKLNRYESLPLFETEAHSLRAIADSNSILCPKPFGYGVHEQQAWLLTEFMELTSQGNDFQRGRDLALMHHQVNRELKPFGWFENNYIGHTPQLNHWHVDWVGFYGEERLRPQLEMAQLNGADPVLYDLGSQLIESLPDWFQDYQPEASLLHGDLWGGNSAFTREGDAVIFDPACYYGDRETDLAMTELFGGFSPDFYNGYHDVFPLDKGYKQRKALYNLYHVLNHFNLFGGHYGQQAEQTIRHLLDR